MAAAGEPQGHPGRGDRRNEENGGRESEAAAGWGRVALAGDRDRPAAGLLVGWKKGERWRIKARFGVDAFVEGRPRCMNPMARAHRTRYGGIDLAHILDRGQAGGGPDFLDDLEHERDQPWAPSSSARTGRSTSTASAIG
jgi:hypothetical protein